MSIHRRRMARRLAREWRPGKAIICDHDWELDVITVYDHTGSYHILVAETQFADEYIEGETYSLWFLSSDGASLVETWDAQTLDIPPHNKVALIVSEWIQLAHEIYEMELDND